MASESADFLVGNIGGIEVGGSGSMLWLMLVEVMLMFSMGFLFFDDIKLVNEMVVLLQFFLYGQLATAGS